MPAYQYFYTSIYCRKRCKRLNWHNFPLGVIWRLWSVVFTLPWYFKTGFYSLIILSVNYLCFSFFLFPSYKRTIMSGSSPDTWDFNLILAVAHCQNGGQYCNQTLYFLEKVRTFCASDLSLKSLNGLKFYESKRQRLPAFSYHRAQSRQENAHCLAFPIQ